MLGEVDNGITLPAEITPGPRIKFARVPCSTPPCRMLGDGVVIRLCHSGVCLNTRSSSSNPIMGGGCGEVTCMFLEVGSICKSKRLCVILSVCWEGSVPHSSPQIHSRLESTHMGTSFEVMNSIWAPIFWLLVHRWLLALCFWASYLTLLFPELCSGDINRSTCLIGLLQE